MTEHATARVLIVEDSDDVLLALRILMEASGHAVATARTIAETVEAGRGAAFDIMLLDLTLPDGDGLEALRALHAEGRAPRVTLALTGRDGSDVRNACLAAGCTDVLVKPVPMRLLMERVNRLVARPD